MEGVGLRIKELRKELYLSQVEFSKRIGVTNAHISAIEKGKTLPSPALIKLISKEFKVTENWLIDGTEPMDALDLECEMDEMMANATSNLNRIMTRDNTPIRSRVIQLQNLFVNILDLGQESDSIKKDYYDICHKLFYHLNSYLDFQKQSLEEGQAHIFPFPDDLIASLKSDIVEFEKFFESTNSV